MSGEDFFFEETHKCKELPNYYILSYDKRFWKDVYTNALVENKDGKCAFCGNNLEENQ